MMRHIFLAAALATFCAAPARAAAPSDAEAIMTTINAFNDAMNKGDMKSAGAVYTANASIIDEFPPHHWSGAHAFDEWVAGFMADSKTNATTEPLMKLYKPRTLAVTGSHAYLVIPALFKFKAHGKPVREPGLFTYAMAKTGDAWKIDAWAWTKK